MLRKFMVAFTSATLFAFAGVANAEQGALGDDQVKGKVQEVMPEQNALILEDGTTFTTEVHIDLDQIAPGTEVLVTFEEQGGMLVATDVRETTGYTRGEEADPQSMDGSTGDIQ